MLRFYLTIDTELSADHFSRFGRAGLEANLACSIWGRTAKGDFGIGHTMDVLERYGMRGVFFVDPLPALVWGTDVIRRIVHPILDRGHDVQLHAHTEWLAFSQRSPVGGRTGRNIKDFCLSDQRVILSLARDFLVAAGAPEPVAFRAGNYGANDDTLRALATIGISHDSSLTPGIARSDCAIGLSANVIDPVEHCGVIEVPVSAIEQRGGGRRHAQLTALSAREILAAVDHAASRGADQFTLVSHSFELMCRQRRVRNCIVARRFEAMCRGLAARENVRSGTYAAHPPGAAAPDVPAALMRGGIVQTALRNIEQAASNLMFGEWRPARAIWRRSVAGGAGRREVALASRQS